MNDKDLFIILKAILWFNPDIPLPSDTDIYEFIKIKKEKFLKLGDKDEIKSN